MEKISLESVFFSNTVLNYLTALGMLFIFLIIFRLLSKILELSLKKILGKTTNAVLTSLLCVDQKLKPIVWYLPFYIISRYLILPAKLTVFIGMSGVLVVTVCVVRYAIAVVKVAVEEYSIRTGGSSMLSHSIGVIANIFCG